MDQVFHCLMPPTSRIPPAVATASFLLYAAALVHLLIILPSVLNRQLIHGLWILALLFHVYFLYFCPIQASQLRKGSITARNKVLRMLAVTAVVSTCVVVEFAGGVAQYAILVVALSVDVGACYCLLVPRESRDYLTAHNGNETQTTPNTSRTDWFGWLHRRTIILDVVQGILIGAALAFVTLLVILPKLYVTKVNGWTTMLGCGEPGNGILLRGACGVVFPGPINVPQEAMYWTTNVDGEGHTLSGAHDFILHFPPGGLPPNKAFWSLTLGDAKNQFVPNPINRYSVSNRSGVVPNADGSVDLYIQNAPPAGHLSNWLPAPTGRFILWLRVYLPSQAILAGVYKVPPIVEARGQHL
jgi:hypothetical protein